MIIESFALTCHVVSGPGASFETQTPGRTFFFFSQCLLSLRNEHRPADGFSPKGSVEAKGTRNH